MNDLLNLSGEVIQWLCCLFVIPLYLDYRRLRRRVEHLEEARRWRNLIESGSDPRDYHGWHDFKERTIEFEAGNDVVNLWNDKQHPTMPRPFPSEPSKRRA